MTPDLEEMIRYRAHEIWEQEGRPHGRHEDHWRQAAEEVTREIERIKADHQTEQADEGAAGEAAPKTRQRRTKPAGEAQAPRARKTAKTASTDDGAAGQEGASTRRRTTKATGGGGAQAEPAAPPARTTRRRATKTEGA